MSENNKSYRIRTTVGEDNFVSVNLSQDYDTFDILSMKISSADLYRLHNSNYGVVVGRVTANGGFGVPNAKISIFVRSDGTDSDEVRAVYSYAYSTSKNESDGIRYNLLPDNKVSECHQIVGTFPNKRYLLDNEVLMEVFDKYYKYTTRTNNSGDYMICGVPTGNHTIHMDLDLSDCGILSQRPRDFVYKGYTIEQFENPNMFKTGTSYNNLSQIFTQDQTVYVQPFWGNESLAETIGITRADMEIAFKFEPTCVFIGSITSDNASNGISKKCIPTPNMGNMDELTTGKGKIEMIRKTYAGDVEEFQVKGTELIDGNGIWCYQIPMNLDYMTTDEYGNMVPTDNPERGIPTRTRVRFRISMEDMEENTQNFFRPKVLVPHNPQNLDGIDHEEYDYEFGTYTKDESFRDLFWNNVYTVKSYIPRFQKRKVAGWKEDKFSGIKHVQNFGQNNPIPYNNIRIRLPFMFKVMCILIKIFVKIVGVVNTLISAVGNLLSDLGDIDLGNLVAGVTLGITKLFKKTKHIYPFVKLYKHATSLKMNIIDNGLCPDLENWYFAPMFNQNLWNNPKRAPDGYAKYNLLKQTLEGINMDDDEYSIDDQNQDDDDVATCLTIRTDYLLSCIEMNLAQEYKVINFDFYNDWINGMVYIPRFMRYVKKKRRHSNGKTIVRAKVKGCMDDTKIFSKSRRYTQLCSIGLQRQNVDGNNLYSKVTANLKNGLQIIKSNNLHKRRGFTQQRIFGKNGGICHEKETMYGQHVYYLKPCEWTLKTNPLNRKVNLYATDIVLLGSLNNCDLYGIPQAFRHLVGSSYIMPTNLALTNMEENGPLYAYGDNGTMCSKRNQTTTASKEVALGTPVRVVNGTLADELKFFSGASTNYDVEYDDPSDTIALTEAAGISWNYTGPGQGKIEPKKMYYPGGHFLGLSCVNSQTNIKSCINLERICELGVSMSQRKEEFGGYNNSTGEYFNRYYAPTGFISGDDIIDDEFRAMFATMNKNRLIADKINPNNGMLMYDFAYSNPINFGGEFAKYAAENTPYNTIITVKDESNELSKYGVEKASSRNDYDESETGKTKTRTIEFPSVDYYMFRFGLSYDDIKKIKPSHTRQFAYEKNGVMYLPQYENSFYFYFGLRDGNTAIDEFNKQFFSECENSTLSEKSPSVTVSVSDFNICSGVSVVVPIIRNMEEPYYVSIDGSGHTYNDEYEIVPQKLSIGSHEITVTDSNGSEASFAFSVGAGIVHGSFTKCDFNREWTAAKRSLSADNIFSGGYLTVEDVSIDGFNGDIEIVGVPYGVNPNDVSSSALEYASISIGETRLYVASANTQYDFYLKYKCDDDYAPDVYLKVASEKFLDTSTVGLTIGKSMRIDYRMLNNSGFTNNWWTGNTYVNDEQDENNGVTGLSWNIRKSLILPYAGEDTPFSNNVMATNGTKAVFGNPQNISGVSNQFCTTEYDDEWPGGYTLDDDASYHPTNVSGRTNYNAMSYDGQVVCGNYIATVTGQTGMSKNVAVINNSLWKPGKGGLFKPLPNGDIVPVICRSNKIDCIGIDIETAKEYTEGVVYPMIEYPVIKRPFSVDCSYVELHRRKISYEKVNGGKNKEAVVHSGVYAERVDAKVTNGITYKKYFGGESYITGISGETDGNTNRFSVNTADKFTGNNRTIYYKSVAFDGDEDAWISNPSFLISEGYPHYKDGNGYCAYKKTNSSEEHPDVASYQSEVEVAGADLTTNFYDDFHYTKVDNTRFNFNGVGITDSDVNYYVVPSGQSENFIQTDDYIYCKRSGQKYYALGHYTSKAMFDEDGDDVIAYIHPKKGHIYADVPWTISGADETFETVEHSIMIYKDDMLINKNHINWYISNIEGASGGKVKFEKQFKISPYYFENALDDHQKPGNKIRSILNKQIEGSQQTFRDKYRITGDNMWLGETDRPFVIIGEKYVGDSVTSGSVYRVYLYPIETKEDMDIDRLVEITDNTLQPTTDFYHDNTTGSVQFSALCANYTQYEISCDEDWVHITNNSQTHSANTNTSSATVLYKHSLSVEQNWAIGDRNADVTVKFRPTTNLPDEDREGRSEGNYTFTITQGGDGSELWDPKEKEIEQIWPITISDGDGTGETLFSITYNGTFNRIRAQEDRDISIEVRCNDDGGWEGATLKLELSIHKRKGGSTAITETLEIENDGGYHFNYKGDFKNDGDGISLNSTMGSIYDVTMNCEVTGGYEPYAEHSFDIYFTGPFYYESKKV